MDAGNQLGSNLEAPGLSLQRVAQLHRTRHPLGESRRVCMTARSAPHLSAAWKEHRAKLSWSATQDQPTDETGTHVSLYPQSTGYLW